MQKSKREGNNTTMPFNPSVSSFIYYTAVPNGSPTVGLDLKKAKRSPLLPILPF